MFIRVLKWAGLLASAHIPFVADLMDGDAVGASNIGTLILQGSLVCSLPTFICVTVKKTCSFQL